jgi:predicted cation transporter
MFDQKIYYLSTACFLLAICHTFFTSKIEVFSHRFVSDSAPKKLFHYLAEVEVVFGLWSLIFFVLLFCFTGLEKTLAHFETLNFNEAKFVTVIMLIASTKPIIQFAEAMILKISKLLPFQKKMSFYLTTLIIGPILGSFITEPAAMTVTSLILLDVFYKDKTHSESFRYATLALLFVNISVGGTLTHFAAPPVVMVASKWNWGLLYMLEHFGYKSLLAVIVSTSMYAFLFRKELNQNLTFEKNHQKIPLWITIAHFLFLLFTVIFSHHGDLLIGMFVFYLSLFAITMRYQDRLKIESAVLVGFFLAGLVYLGNFQAYWISEFFKTFSGHSLNIGATVLTSITDNALITYLGTLAPLSESSKYFLLAGAVTGGGLTVIANAPNPVGFGILRDSFGEKGIGPLSLLLWALIPTIISSLCFLFLPNLNW